MYFQESILKNIPPNNIKYKYTSLCIASLFVIAKQRKQLKTTPNRSTVALKNQMLHSYKKNEDDHYELIGSDSHETLLNFLKST